MASWCPLGAPMSGTTAGEQGGGGCTGVPATLGTCTLPGPACLQGGCQALGWAHSGLTPVAEGEGSPLTGNTWPKMCMLGWASPHKPHPKGLPHPQHPRRGEHRCAPPHSWAHPPSTQSCHPWTQPFQTPQSPKPLVPLAPPTLRTLLHAVPPARSQPPPQQPPALLSPAAAASPLRYCQRVASASVCEINSEVERENYVKCGYSGAAGEARLMAKCLFVCLICIFFQRCIFRRVICCLFRPRSVSFLQQWQLLFALKWMLRNFQEIAEAPLAAQPRRPGHGHPPPPAPRSLPAGPCPRPPW